MFGLFKKKSPIEILELKHKKVLEEAFNLSKVNRAESDKKYQEADDIEKEIEKLKTTLNN